MRVRAQVLESRRCAAPPTEAFTIHTELDALFPTPISAKRTLCIMAPDYGCQPKPHWKFRPRWEGTQGETAAKPSVSSFGAVCRRARHATCHPVAKADSLAGPEGCRSDELA
jgi:hypothetical protein